MTGVPLLHDFLLDSARRLPDKVALVAHGRRLTYQDLDRQSNALAHALAARGVLRGDRVVVLAENSPDAAVAFWAVLKADAVVSMVSPQTRPDRLAWLLNDCRASAVVSEASLAATLGPAARQARHLRAVVVAGVESGDPRLEGVPGLADLAQVIAAAKSDGAPRRRAIDVDLAALVYTSGSTGEPKGVMLTHRNMLTAARSILACLGTGEDDVILGALPLSFDYGLYQMIMAFAVGARLVLERSSAYPARVLDRLVEERVTVLPGVPTLFAMLLRMDHLTAWDLSAVRTVTSTAAALPTRHIVRLREIFPRARVFSMYGLTECKRCTILPPEDLDWKPGSVGLAIPNTELWIADEAGNRLGPGQVGELVIRGATVMAGYWDKPEETARRLRPGPLPGERVLYTGDLCRLDEDGYLTFVARMDDVIKSRGEKVPPRAVENALLDIDGVSEAAVVGVPDEILGHAIRAFVVLEPGAELDEQQIRRSCQVRLEGFMVPREIRIVAELPRSANGKVRKSDLAAASSFHPPSQPASSSQAVPPTSPEPRP